MARDSAHFLELHRHHSLMVRPSPCCITNGHNVSSLTRHSLLFHSFWGSCASTASLAPLLRASQACSSGVSQGCSVIRSSTGERGFPMQPVGRSFPWGWRIEVPDFSLAVSWRLPSGPRSLSHLLDLWPTSGAVGIKASCVLKVSRIPHSVF